MTSPRPRITSRTPGRETAPTKVVITTAGVSVSIETTEPLEVAADRAQQLHQEAYKRCVPDLPRGFGGAL